MASPIFTLLTTTLKWAFAEISTLMHSYCSNDAVTLLNAAKSLNIRSLANFKSLKFTCILSASQSAYQPSIRPSCISTHQR